MSSKLKNVIFLFVGSFLEKLYTKYAFAYDLVAWIVSNGNWNKWVLEIIPHIKEGKVLELGFGTGHLFAQLKQNSVSVFGIDKSKSMIKLAAKNFIKRTKPDHKSGNSLSLIRSCAEALPFQSNFFDTAIATFPSNFIENPSTINNIYRVLKEDGKLLVLLAVKPIGKSLPITALRLLYIITGQSISNDSDALERIADFFSEQGFETQVRWINLENFRLLLVESNK